jgi:hypothetical protein
MGYGIEVFGIGKLYNVQKNIVHWSMHIVQM